MTLKTPYPSIPEWFCNRSVLVTGGTGFMGKVLVSKLLLSCPDLGNVFLIVREKKGIDPKTRLQQMIQTEPFRVLREKHEERLKKLVIIPGDTCKNNLDLSDTDKERLINEVAVVFHMAANVRFDLSLKTAVSINTGGTLNLINLSKQMKKLDAFIHVSTSFCQCGEDILEERAYPVPLSPHTILSAINTMGDEILDAMTPKLLKQQPNTYAFSKALSEDLVSKSNLPVGIARPSIVFTSWKEPVPGWVENMNGPTGLMVGAGKGVIRSMHCNPNYLAEIIPCDIAINSIIAMAWHVGNEKPSSALFVNITDDNPITWGEAVETGRKHVITNPFSGPLWYPGGKITSSKIIHLLSVLFFHLIPAYFLDALLYLTGNKPFLVRIQKRVTMGQEILQYYTTKKWVFPNDAKKDLQSRLCAADKETFFMDTSELNWDEFILKSILGIRKYYLKDDPSTLPRARRVFTYLYYADLFVKFLFVGLIAWLAFSWMAPLRSVIPTLIDGN